MGNDAILSNEINTQKISDYVHHVLADLSASERIRMTHLGSQLGFYKAMAFAGPMTVGELARRTRTNVRLVKHWVDSLAAEGYLIHEPEADTFMLPAEHAIAMTDPESPYYIGGRFESASGGKAKKAMGDGNAGKETDSPETLSLTYSSARFFSELYLSSLFNNWLPGVEGLVERLQRGGQVVADLGCARHGATTLILAKAFPSSTFYGFDTFASSVERASLLAKEKHIQNVHFERATAEQVYARQYDLITLIECLQHLGETKNVLHECYEVLKPDGVLVVVESKDSSQVSEELYQRLRSVRTRTALADEVLRVEIGIDTRERELDKVAREAGFTLFRKVTETLYDKVYEMRP